MTVNLTPRPIYIDQDDRVSASEADGLLRLGYAALRRLIRTGVLGHHKVGRCTYVSLPEIVALLEEREKLSTS